tara:strand:- start:38039 stop:38458 length:420 start_codon:yes stop_codon:yes gene_type:complete
MTSKKLTMWASGFYLTEHLPDDYDTWDDDILDEWMIAHAWEPFEFWTLGDVWDQITTLANATRDLLKEEKKNSKIADTDALIGDLTKKYVEWTAQPEQKNHAVWTCGREMLCKEITYEQREWLERFCLEWDDAERGYHL